jgi:hypothetical protein
MTGARAILLTLIGLVAVAGDAVAAPVETPAARPEHPAGDVVVLARVEPMPRSLPPDERCTADGAHCIKLASYIPDVCRTIEAVARANALDAGFFARLIWKESLFDAGALSPKGAQGIAQFIPDTARMRGLDDPFNPAEALSVSAAYLAELSRDYGNIGLAAVAYNGGEGLVARFIAGKSGLPDETRGYVQSITGHSAEAWRDAPPESVDLSLKGESFQAACIAQAASRSLREFKSEPPVLPWGVIVASNRERGGAERQVARLQNRHAAVLAGEPVAYTRDRRPGMARNLYFAQVGRPTRSEAEALCGQLRAAGGDCMVLRN